MTVIKTGRRYFVPYSGGHRVSLSYLNDDILVLIGNHVEREWKEIRGLQVLIDLASSIDSLVQVEELVIELLADLF